ncbi:MAG: oxidoreductase [Erysipelotrichaceae bacterium]|nr:oxidoreductase [Erysipelotrichaceae bacterium]
MIYRDFQNEKLSALGFGAMRLPVIDGNDRDIDEAKTQEMVERAYEAGINYFDTAWGYHGGNSETVLGKCLAKLPRESFNIATKFPGYDLNNMPKVKEIFEQQLEKTGMEYFDFYLFHNVCEMNIDAYLNPEYGIFDYLMAQKKAGKIRHLGFSCHGSYDVLKRFLDAYGEHMEFCQLQLNYLDWTFQGGKEKVDLLNQMNIPVWVMEPLRGGKLAHLSEADEKILRQLRPDEDPAAWAFRFLQSQKGITMILSGMSAIDQLEKNLKTFAEDRKLNETEMKAIEDLAERMLSVNTVPCTACHYCVTHCPMGLDIPHLISLYNEHVYTGGGFIAPMALSALDDDKKPQACLHCRSCEAVCPQQIRISEIMSDFAERI